MVGLPTTKFKLAMRVLPILFIVAILKIIVHYYGLEFLALNTVFTALISANIFLIGFNISGVLADFKEGEKLPGELASNIEAIADECVYVYKGKKAEAGREGFLYCVEFTDKTLDWLYKRVRTRTIMKMIASFTDRFLALEPFSQASSVSRLKHGQSEIRKATLRIHAIREIRFSEAAYTIAEIITFMLTAGMIFLKFDPFYEGVFLTIFVSFILIYMLLLIRDLDDPFAYYDKKHSIEEVSLHSLENLKIRLEERRKEIEL
ncbi:MAG: hypothetical protein WC926_02670 [Candidatus Paceibacterota bacterium]|jgi:hypothetical protein